MIIVNIVLNMIFILEKKKDIFKKINFKMIKQNIV